MKWNDEIDNWEKEELDGLDLEDQMDILIESREVCSKCDGEGCNYCLMLEY